MRQGSRTARNAVPMLPPPMEAELPEWGNRPPQGAEPMKVAPLEETEQEGAWPGTHRREWVEGSFCLLSRGGGSRYTVPGRTPSGGLSVAPRERDREQVCQDLEGAS